MKKLRTNITNREYETLIKYWLMAVDEHNGIEWIAKQMGIGKSAISRRARFLRSKGVRLPKLDPREEVFEKDRLNALIKGHKAK